MKFRIESETGVLRDVLLCRPEYYEWLPISELAQESIAAGRSFDRDKALAQHQLLVDALRTAVVNCHFIEAVEALPDLCWTRDSSQVTPWGPAITCLSEPARGEENRVVREYYEQQEATLWYPQYSGAIEGGDIHIIRPGLILVGHSSGRTSESAAKQFAEAFEKEGWDARLEKIDDRFVHLDVVFCMAATGTALLCKEAVSTMLPDWLAKRGIATIDVSVADVEQLACNCLSLGNDRVILAGRGFEVADTLRSKNIEVFELDLDMFTLAGGGVHCLTQPLRRDPV